MIFDLQIDTILLELASALQLYTNFEGYSR